MPNSSAIAEGDQASASVMEFNDALAKADGGNAYAQAVVSIYYGLGYKVQKDIEKSAIYAAKSAQQGNPLGLYRVGVIIQRGEGVPKNEPQGIAVKLKARKGLNTMANDPYAITALAIMEFRGEGVPKNKSLAANLYKKAADMGYAPAQYNYSCLLTEPGSGGDLNEAAIYKQKAAEQGYPPKS
jgi:TPR repeat protein